MLGKIGRREVLRLQAGILVVLCGWIGLQTGEAFFEQQYETLTISPHAPTRYDGGQIADAVFPDATLVRSWKSTELARPLFSTNRLPFLAVVQAVPSAVNEAQLPPRLSGIVVTPELRLAIFGNADGVPIIVMQGQCIGPFRVLRIEANDVQVMGPYGMKMLHVDIGASYPATTHALDPAPTIAAGYGNPAGRDLWPPQLGIPYPKD